MFETAQRIRLGDSLLTEDMYSLIETEEEREQLFNPLTPELNPHPATLVAVWRLRVNAGMNNGRNKEDK
jgi:hypothetical protein